MKSMIASIDTIEIKSVRIPLPTPVQLGEVTIAHRDYVVLRMILSDGSEGYAYGYDRGLPLFDLCRRAAMTYLGKDPRHRRGLFRQAIGPTPAPHAAMTRGASLCDIALWDAWTRSQSLPLWSILGAERDRVPVMPIIGYGMSADVAAEEAAKFAKAGFRYLKCMIDGGDLEADTALLTSVRAAVSADVEIGIDAHWSWQNARQAIAWSRVAERLDISFIEDPFTPTQVHSISELAARTSVPLAVGEDVPDIYGFCTLVPHIGTVRVDASVSGGICGTADVIALARAFDRTVIPHVFPHLHMHFGIASTSVRCIEMIAPSVAADPIDQFLLDSLHLENGDALAQEKPGAGLALDWTGLQRHELQNESMSR